MTKSIWFAIFPLVVGFLEGEASVVISPINSVMTSGFFQGVDQVRGYAGDARPILRASSPAPFGLGQPEGIYFDFTSLDLSDFKEPTSSAILSVTSISGGFNADAGPENPFLISAHGVGINPLLSIEDDTNAIGFMGAVEFEANQILPAISSVSVDSFGLIEFDVSDLFNDWIAGENLNYFIALTGRNDLSGNDFLHGFSNSSEIPGATFLTVDQIPESSVVISLFVGSLTLFGRRSRVVNSLKLNGSTH